MNFKNKRGAIELSMTTIIVIVIGITLLSLGLIWVKNTFSNIGDMTQKQFDQADQIIDATPNTDEKISVPIQINAKSGKDTGFTFYVRNDGTSNSNDFNIKIDDQNDPSSGVKTGMVGYANGEVVTKTIESNDRVKINCLVRIPSKIKSGTYEYRIVVNNGDYAEQGFAITVGN
jgi:hypothetical protein